MIRTFTIATSGDYGTRRWWLVRIHPTLAALRASAAAYDPRTDYTTSYGVCHTAMWVDTVTGAATRYGGRGYAGLIRLAATALTGATIAHELLHAAVAVYRMNHHQQVYLGGESGTDEEEHLARIFGELHQDFCRHVPYHAVG